MRPANYAVVLLLGQSLAQSVHSAPRDPADTAPPVATLRVGDGTLDGAIVRPYDNVWLVTVHYSDGRRDERGLSSDHVRTRTIAGRTYGTRIEGTTLISGYPDEPPIASEAMTFNVFDLTSMAPVTGVELSADGRRVEHDFQNLTVIATAQPSGSPAQKPTKIELPSLVYDFEGGMKGLVLAALPLKIGYQARLPVLGDNGFDTETIKVLRQESISAGHLGNRKTFVVQIGPTPSSETYWISRKPPYVIKVEEHAVNAVVTWDMLD